MPEPASVALVVDDSATVRLVLTRLLKPLGFDVRTAGDGKAALAAARGAARPAVMLVDRTMPGMDGLDLLRALRADPVLRAIPVLMVTAASAKGEVEEALAAGADEYLMKPVTREALASKLALLGFEAPEASVEL